MRWLLGWWHALQRRFDLVVLWPECVKAAHGNHEHALGAFMFHTTLDPAWRDLSDEEVNRIVADLK